jgi:hypothetical protein
MQSGFMQGYPVLHRNAVNANPLPADWSGTNLSGTDLHLPEGRQARIACREFLPE